MRVHFLPPFGSLRCMRRARAVICPNFGRAWVTSPMPQTCKACPSKLQAQPVHRMLHPPTREAGVCVPCKGTGKVWACLQ